MFTLHVFPALGPDRMDRIGPSQITRLHNSLKATPFAANRVLSLLSHVFTKARQWAVLPAGHVNPCADVERFPERKRKRYLTATEQARVGQALTTVKASVYAVGALRVLALTGARPDEIVRLRRDQLTESVHQTGKTGERQIYLEKHAREIIAALPEVQGNPFVFVGRHGRGHVTATSLNHVWKVVRAQAGVLDVRLYDLRHTFAYVARRQGKSWPDIGALLGHRRPETTMRYAHIDDEAVQEASAEVGDAIAKALKPGR
jgi:integrase